MLCKGGYTPLHEKHWADLLESRQGQSTAHSNADASASLSHEGDKRELRLMGGSLAKLLHLPPCIADTPVDAAVVPDGDDYHHWSTPPAHDVKVASAAISTLRDGPVAKVLQTTDVWKCLVRLTKGCVARKRTKGNLFTHYGQPYRKQDSVKPWISTCLAMMGAYTPGQAIRDFYAPWFLWVHAGTMTGREAVACSKALTLTTAADYLDEEDGMPGVGLSDFAEAIGNALEGEGDYAPAIDLVNVTASLMDMRKGLKRRLMENDITDIADEWVGPHEFMAARWWDGAMLASINMARVISSSTASLMAGACGKGSGTTCAKAWNALDTTIHYNEIVDIISDDRASEPLNEVLAAAKYGRGCDHSRYHDVVASSIVDVFECRCGGAGHEWARRMALGTAAWYALVPRYGGLAQQRTMRKAQQRRTLQTVHNACVWDHDIFCNTTPILTRSEYGAYNDAWALAGVDNVVDTSTGCQACACAVRHLNARCSIDGHIFTADELHAAVTGGDIISLVCRVSVLGQCPEWLVGPVMAIGQALSDDREDLGYNAKLYVTFDLALNRALAEGGSVSD